MQGGYPVIDYAEHVVGALDELKIVLKGPRYWGRSQNLRLAAFG